MSGLVGVSDLIKPVKLLKVFREVPLIPSHVILSVMSINLEKGHLQGTLVDRHSYRDRSSPYDSRGRMEHTGCEAENADLDLLSVK